MTSLTAELMSVHAALAGRQNLSSVTVASCAAVEKPLLDCIAAALLTLGGLHGPIVQTYEMLAEPDPEWFAADILQRGMRVPGWGSGFVRAGPDPVFSQLDSLLHADHQEIWRKVAKVTQVLHDAGKTIYPNAACYTAAVAIVTGLPSTLSPTLFVRGRLEAWFEIFAANHTPRLGG